MENNLMSTADFNNQPIPISESQVANAVSDVLRQVYLWMMAGLLVTAVVGWYVSGSETLLNLVFGNQIVFWGLIIGQLALVFVASAGAWRFAPSVALTLFFVYAALNGVLFAFVFLAYTGGSIALTFGITALVFGAMSVVGLTTKTDLTQYRSFFMMGLIGLIGASLVNWWISSPVMDWVLTYAGIALFLGLAAYNTQRIKKMTIVALASGQFEAISQRIAISGALSLYIDFINLFLRLLRIFGRRR
jgi:FtsH-binding integral membrane protein